MSKHVHCDNCDGLIYRTFPGQELIGGEYDIEVNHHRYEFCSQSCQQQYVRQWIWGEVSGGSFESIPEWVKENWRFAAAANSPLDYGSVSTPND